MYCYSTRGIVYMLPHRATGHGAAWIAGKERSNRITYACADQYAAQQLVFMRRGTRIHINGKNQQHHTYRKEQRYNSRPARGLCCLRPAHL